jgi:hypothetical protein
MAIDLSKMTMPEIFKHVSELPATERGDALRTIANLVPNIGLVLQYTYNTRFVFDLPEGSPPYRKLNIPENWGYNRLPKELRKFKYFIKSETPNLARIKREQLFIEMLESLSEEEAELVIMIKDKKLKYNRLTNKFVRDTLPELFVGEVAEEKAHV